MIRFRIASYDGRPDSMCASSEELYEALLSLGNGAVTFPTLINVYDDEERAAIVGVGSAISTVQLIDKLHGQTHRSASGSDTGDDSEFSYQGEATFIRPRFLVPLEQAVRAVVAWLSQGTLIPEISWLTGDFPPSIR